MSKPIMVSTIHQGVFAGTVPDDQDLTVKVMTLDECRVADEWGFDQEVSRLATDGPGATASISVGVTMVIQDITAVWVVAPAAWAAWQAGVWAPVGSRRGRQIAASGGGR